MRIGELLVQQGLVTAVQLDAALAAQHQFGRRVGSMLVELGYLDEDTLARALSHQLGVPAAMNKHFAGIDPKVIALFTPRLAESHNAIPLGFTGTKPARLIVAFVDPVTTSKEEIAFVTGTRVDPGVAPQRQIARFLEKLYGVRRTSRFVDVNFAKMTPNMSSAPPPPAPPPPAAPIVKPPAVMTLSVPPPPIYVDPPSLPMLTAEPPPPSLPEVHAAGPTREEEEQEEHEEPAEEPDQFVAGAFTVDESSLMAVDEPPAARRQSVYAELRAPLDRDEVKEVLEAAATRDEIGDALSDYLRSACGCGLVLIVKDGMALGWKGFAPAVDASVIEAIALPLTAPSIFRTVNESREPFRGPPRADGAALQNRLWKLIRCTPPDEVVVVPVAFGKRVVNLVYAHGITGEMLPETTISELTEVCAFGSAAYARIIRKKK